MDDLNLNNQRTETSSPSASVLAGVVDMLSRWRRVIFYSLALGFVVSTTISFLITPQFKSTASVFPAEKADLFGALEGVSSLVKSISGARSLAALTSSPEQDRYMAILKSGRVLNSVIAKFDLVKIYDITSYPAEKTVKELLSNVEFSSEMEGNIVITVYDKDPQRAADMANFFVEELNRANTNLQVQNARGTRKFIQERYKANLRDLAVAEDSLKFFQKRHGIIAMPEQATAAIKANAEMAAQLAIKEVQLAVERRTLSADHPAVIASQIEVQEFRGKINQMNTGTGTSAGKMKALISLESVPELGVEYVRRYREVEVQYKILQFILPLYEQAKVEEQRQTPSVVVLDAASPSERKARPKRLAIILGGIVVALFASLSYAALADRWKDEKERGTLLYSSVSALVTKIKSDVNALREYRRGRG